jgi:hypothetical protein
MFANTLQPDAPTYGSAHGTESVAEGAKAGLSAVGGVVARQLIAVRSVQPEKAELGIFVTLLPILSVTKDVLPENPPDCKLVALKFMVAMLVQLENALYAMLVTPLGMVTSVMLLQLENASPPMLVTPLEMVTSARLVQS